MPRVPSEIGMAAVVLGCLTTLLYGAQWSRAAVRQSRPAQTAELPPAPSAESIAHAPKLLADHSATLTPDELTADTSHDLIVLDASDPHRPVAVEQFSLAARRVLGLTADEQGVHSIVWRDRLQVFALAERRLSYELYSGDSARESTNALIARGLAYLVDRPGGLAIHSLESSSPARAVARIDLPGFIRRVVAHGPYVYLVAASSGITILDVRDPPRPVVLGKAALDWPAHDLAVINGFGYVTTGTDGLRVLDVRDPTWPVEVGRLPTDSITLHIVAMGHHLYVTDYDGHLTAWDVRVPKAPIQVSRRRVAQTPRGLAAAGSQLYIADGPCGLRVLDLSEPATPTQTAAYVTRGLASHVAAVGSEAYLVSSPALPLADCRDLNT